MSNSDLVTESREVSNFDRVVLRDYGELVITQGEQESLTVEADRDILPRIKTEVRDGALVISIGGGWFDKVSDVITTSLTRKRIKFSLIAKKLTSLEVYGAANVDVSRIETDRLGLRLTGAGQVRIESLTAESLEVDLPGAGKISVAGRVAEQTVTLSGAGSYDAPKLESQRAKATLTGLGSATVWAIEELDATIRGLGNVEYYGTPTVRKSVSGVGSVKSLGNP